MSGFRPVLFIVFKGYPMALHFATTLFLVMISLAGGIYYIVIREKYPMAGQIWCIANPSALACLLALALLLLMTGVYSLAGHPDFLTPLASAAAFLLPQLIQLTWVQYQGIPDRPYPVWYSRETEASPLSKTPVARIEITFHILLPNRSEPILVRSQLVRNQALGKAFLNAQNKTSAEQPHKAIEVFDEQHHPYGWQFYLLQLNGFKKKFLDPKRSLAQLSIKEQSIVEVRRQNSQPPVSYRMKL
jgi:Type VI secretion system, TssN